MCISPKLPLATISCLFTDISGSAMILTRVFSKPIPASAVATATFTLAGNNSIAVEALPSKRTVSLLIPSSFIFDLLKNGAPASDLGCCRNGQTIQIFFYASNGI